MLCIKLDCIWYEVDRPKSEVNTPKNMDYQYIKYN